MLVFHRCVNSRHFAVMIDTMWGGVNSSVLRGNSLGSRAKIAGVARSSHLLSDLDYINAAACVCADDVCHERLLCVSAMSSSAQLRKVRCLYFCRLLGGGYNYDSTPIRLSFDVERQSNRSCNHRHRLRLHSQI